MSDTFLERAMDTHMSAFEESEESDQSSKKKTTSVTPRRSADGLFIVPQSPPKSATVTDSPRTPLLMKRKMTQRGRRKLDSKISPGNLVMSDSESDGGGSPSVATKSTDESSFLESTANETTGMENLTVVDVCASRELLETFSKEWSEQREFSLALACANLKGKKGAKEPAAAGIGGNIMLTRAGKKRRSSGGNDNKDGGDEEANALRIDGDGLTAVGLAVNWEGLDVYYVQLLGSEKVYGKSK